MSDAVSVTRLPPVLALALGPALLAPTTAHAHADDVATSDLGSAWQPAPAVLVVAAIALALFVQAYLRLRRRGRADHAGRGRLVLFVAGVAVIVLALVSPLDAAGEEYLLSAHMLQHLVIADIGPLLLLLAVRGPLVFFLLPARVLRRLAPVRPLRALLGFFLRPVVAFSLWLVVVPAWHIPRLYEYALAHPLAHELEHFSFMAVGLLAWSQLIDPARHGRLTRGGRIGFALGMLVLGHPVIDSLLFGSLAYPTYAAQDERLLGLSAEADQRLAGALMMGEQLATLGTFVAVLLIPLVREWRARRPALASDELP